MTESTLTLGAATAEVLSVRHSLVEALPMESVGLDRIAGRVLAEGVVADRDVPARGRATMDGFAVRTDDDPPLDVGDVRVGPGEDPPDLDPTTTVRIATGAALPAGADAVVPVEEATVEGGRLVGVAPDVGRHVVERGSVVAAGETVLAAGRRLAPRDAAICRELGRDAVSVRRRLATALLATGTEIHEGREPDRDSETLASLVRAWGGDPVLRGSVPDDPRRVADRVDSLAADHDVVVTTGGTGVSGGDETAGALADRATVLVPGVGILPGSRATVATLRDTDAALASLPGPPGAAFASAILLLRPLFVGENRDPTVGATMARDLSVPDRSGAFVVPVELTDGGTADGRPTAMPFGHPDSSVRLYDERFRPHRVSACARLSAADGFVVTGSALRSGQSVAVRPYSAVES